MVKPRSQAEDWLAIKFDPWSAGKERFHSQFIKVLDLQDDEEVQAMDASASKLFPTTKSMLSGDNKAEFLTGAAKKVRDLETLFSHCRHGKYEEIEEVRGFSDNLEWKDRMSQTILMDEALFCVDVGS